MKPSHDSMRAQKIASLALEFMNTNTPLSSEHIHSCYYPDLSKDSFRRAYLRDRTLLAATGITVTECLDAFGNPAWCSDKTSSFANGCTLTPCEAQTLELACRGLLYSADFLLRDDLRFALAKINRAFGDAYTTALPTPLGRVPGFSVLFEAYLHNYAVSVHYSDASGNVSQRVLAPWGFFSVSGSAYCVASLLNTDGTQVSNHPKTYRCERFLSVKPLKTISYNIPADFCVDEYRFLPFQIGNTAGVACFCVPEEHKTFLSEESSQKGVFSECGETLEWTVDFASVDTAARWGISQGLIPLKPQELVEAWIGVLKAAANTQVCTSNTFEVSKCSQRPKKPGRRGALEEARELVVLISSLAESGDSLSAGAIASMLGVDIQHAQDLMSLILETCVDDGIYLPLIQTDDEELVFLGGSRTLKGQSLALTSPERTAMHLALSYLGVDSSDAVYGRLFTNTSADHDLQHLTAGAYYDASDTLLVCAESCLTNRPIEFSYQKPGTTGNDTTLSLRSARVTSLHFERDRWYVDAYDIARDAIRCFRLDRMRGVHLIQKNPNNKAATKEAEEHTCSAHSLLRRLIFTDVYMAEILPWHKLQIVSKGKDGMLLGETPDYGGEWMVRMVCACGGHIYTTDQNLALRVRDYAKALLLRI